MRWFYEQILSKNSLGLDQIHRVDLVGLTRMTPRTRMEGLSVLSNKRIFPSSHCNFMDNYRASS